MKLRFFVVASSVRDVVSPQSTYLPVWIWAQVLWSLLAHVQVPASLWELAELQSIFVLVFVCLITPADPAQIPRLSMDTIQILIGIRQRWFFFFKSQH